MSDEKIYDIKDRTFLFSKNIIFFIKSTKYNRIYHSIFDQLLRSATFIGANITEGKAGSSKSDFLKFHIIALKSAKETEYWLNLVNETQIIDGQVELQSLLKEIDEIIRILVTIIVRSKS